MHVKDSRYDPHDHRAHRRTAARPRRIGDEARATGFLAARTRGRRPLPCRCEALRPSAARGAPSARFAREPSRCAAQGERRTRPQDLGSVTVADTDALIDFLHGSEPGASRVARLLEAGELATTAITVAELAQGLRSERERRDLEILLDAVNVLP